MLHTWNQQLGNHWHVHLLVPGAGPSVDNQGWTSVTPPIESDNDEGFYLVDADNLRERYRTTFLRRLDNARAAGKLQLTGRHACLQDDDKEWLIESAKENQPKPAAPLQLHLPGFERFASREAYLLDSL